MGYVYCVVDTHTKNYKIGFSVDPINRLKQLQTGHCHELEMIYFAKGNKFFEKKLQNSLDKYWLKGEWYSKINVLTKLFFIHNPLSEKRVSDPVAFWKELTLVRNKLKNIGHVRLYYRMPHENNFSNQTQAAHAFAERYAIFFRNGIESGRLTNIRNNQVEGLLADSFVMGIEWQKNQQKILESGIDITARL